MLYEVITVSGLAGLDQPTPIGRTHVPGAVQVQVHDRTEAIRGDLDRGGLELPPRVVDEDVGQGVLIDDRIEERGDLILVADVDGMRVSFDSLGTQLDDRFFEP